MPILIAWLLLMTLGFTLLVTALGGRFRDAVAIAPLVVQAGIFLTPVGYPLSAAGIFAKVLAFNPASGVIEAWRWSLLGMAPDMFAIVVGARRDVVVVRAGLVRLRPDGDPLCRLRLSSTAASLAPTSRSAARESARATAWARS